MIELKSGFICPKCDIYLRQNDSQSLLCIKCNKKYKIENINSKLIVVQIKEDELNENRHLYLYVKMHYKKTNIVEDLKRIYINNKSQFKHYNITRVMLIKWLFTVLAEQLNFSGENMMNIMFMALPVNCHKIGYSNEYDTELALIHSICNFMRFTDLNNIKGNLGDVDNNILTPINYIEDEVHVDFQSI